MEILQILCICYTDLVCWFWIVFITLIQISPLSTEWMNLIQDLNILIQILYTKIFLKLIINCGWSRRKGYIARIASSHTSNFFFFLAYDGWFLHCCEAPKPGGDHHCGERSSLSVVQVWWMLIWNTAFLFPWCQQASRSPAFPKILWAGLVSSFIALLWSLSKDTAAKGPIT